MKTLVKYIPLLALPISMGLAQGGDTTNSIPSSLKISGERSQEERIQFLLDVAQSYSNEEDIASAIGSYERILAIDPTHVQARYVVGHLYISIKEYKKAETVFLALIEEFPEDFKLWNNMAWLCATAEDPSIRDGNKAIKFAHEAMTLAPNDYHVWSTLSEAYYVSGDYEKAHRAILQMARLAVRYGTDVTEESVKEYNQQILKCKRAMDTAKSMETKEEQE
jgi:tetratricopeptide (TPR) repeat protein